MITRERKHESATFAPYELASRMSQAQLELAWLGAIYFQPDLARNVGIGGLDQSMFTTPNIFYLGLEMLKADSFTVKENQLYPVPPQDILEQLMQHRLVSKLEMGFDEMHFMPGFYKKYCEEIEARAAFR